ncbi:MAG: PepSY domain-containing protein, partial [Bacteroidetes bacterium]|nr:PepSY domain-containing protein [Bacteroidota bacterium]
MHPIFRLACLAVVFFHFFSIKAQEIWEGQKAEKFLAGSELIRFKEGHKTPDFFRFRQGHERPLSEASALLNKLLSADENTSWKEIKHEKDELGFEHITYHQFQGNVPVEFSFYRLHVKQGRIVSGNGQWHPLQPNSTVAAISQSQAIQAATNSIHATSYKWENPEEESRLKWELNQQGATYYPNPTLVFAPISPEINKSEFRLAYKLDVYASEPLSRHDVFVDAMTGQVLWKVNKIHTADSNGTANTVYSGNRPIVSDYNNGSYRLRESGRGNGIQTFDLNNGTNYGSAVDFTDADNIWNNVNASLDQYAGDAHWGAETTYDYFMLIHNRNSIDGNGFTLRSYIHYSNSYNNAFWDGQRMT